MANTFSQIYYQLVFAVQNRTCLIPKKHKEQWHKYITALVQNRNTKRIAFHCMPDHTHLFVGYKPVVHIPDLIKEIKVESNEYINHKGRTKGKFTWQQGYGGFNPILTGLQNMY